MREHSPGPDHSEPLNPRSEKSKMTSAKTSTMNPARRAFLSRAANVAAGGAALTVAATTAGLGPATQSSPDPILEAIEAHKAARAVVYSAVDGVSAAEQELRGRGLKPTSMRGNSPRLDACEGALSQAFDAETEAACVLVTVRPTTIAGVLALMQYANAADIDGQGWPSDLCSDDDTKTRSWHYFLIETVTAALTDLVSA
jgi:hypothetical protein